MDREAYKIFATLEHRHWWFLGRRKLYGALLRDVLTRDRGAPPADLTVLDVGCGTGGFLGELGRLGRVVGLEMESAAIEHCRGQGFTDTLVARCDAVPLAAGCADVACLFDVLEHTPDDVAVLREVRRSLAPGGHVAVSVPAYQFLFAHNDRTAHHFRRYTRGRLLKALREAGFEVRRATYVNVLLGLFIVPAVLLFKLKERVFGPPSAPGANNLTVRTPRLLNALFAKIFAGERHVLRHVSSPFGHSVFAVARNPG